MINEEELVAGPAACHRPASEEKVMLGLDAIIPPAKEDEMRQRV